MLQCNPSAGIAVLLVQIPQKLIFLGRVDRSELRAGSEGGTVRLRVVPVLGEAAGGFGDVAGVSVATPSRVALRLTAAPGEQLGAGRTAEQPTASRRTGHGGAVRGS